MNRTSRFFRAMMIQGEGQIASRFFASILVVLWLFELANYLGILSYSIDYTWLGLVVSSTTVLGVILSLQYFFTHRLKTPLPSQVWLCGALLVIGDFSGDFFRLYKGWERYDQVMHFVSGPLLVGAFLVIFEGISRVQAWRQPGYVPYLLALGTDVIWAVLYEAEEYLEDLLFQSNRLGDGPDTANDLLVNLIGGVLLIAITVAYRRYVSRSRSVAKLRAAPLRFRSVPL